MKKQISTNLLVLVATIAYNFLFWSEKMGVNSLIFILIMLPILFWTHPEGRKSKPALVTAAGTLVTAILIVWNNSLLTKVVHMLSFVTFVGFVQARVLRFVWFGFLLGMMNIFSLPIKIKQLLPDLKESEQVPRLAFRRLRLSVLPLLVVLVFYVIYYNANPAFSSISDQFWAAFFDLFSFDISLSRVLFFISGLFICGGMILKLATTYFQKQEAERTENLVRVREKAKLTFKKISMIGLKNEHVMALGLLVSLNVLLLLVNILDIVNVWFGNAPENPLLLKNYVHEGTYLLILAILLAMGLVLFFFRKNLNFYKNNKWLRIFSYCWIAQNGLLAISVFIRNYHYIHTCGLAYKRIGVMVFLALTLFGLYTLILKIRDKKTFYFLLHRNSWALYFTLLMTTFVNWDVFITQYNLTADTKNGIDVQFLLQEVSDKNLFLLEANIDRMKERSSSPHFQKYIQITSTIERKRKNFEWKRKEHSWLSWNYADARNQE